MRYKSAEEQPKKKTGENPSKLSRIITFALIIVGLYFIAIYYHIHLLNRTEDLTHLQPPPPAAIPEETETKSEDILPWTPITIKRGETLAKIFTQYHLSTQDLHAILQLKNTALLRSLKAGQRIRLLFKPSTDPKQANELMALEVPLDKIKTLSITKDSLGYHIKMVNKPLTIKTIFAAVTIKNSLLAAANSQHIPKAVTWQLLKIFAQRVDLTHLRSGDKLLVEYQMIFLKNQFVKSSDVVAAILINRGTTYTAIQYQTAQGHFDYYMVDGESLKKGFLRRPVPNSWVSSPFNMHRFHPILGYVRPHTGTDFAANYGTPIHATGDGHIIKDSWYGGYGRCVMIDHGHGIVTLYGHMSRFAKGLHVGSAVKENQVIGYIGESGLAKGAHVHYEFRINGQFHDPMKVKLPEANPLSRRELTQFTPYAKLQIARLQAYSKGQNPNIMTVSATPTPTTPTSAPATTPKTAH